MADLKQFKLPDVGEGLTEAEIVSWKVRPGQRVAVNDTLVEIETAKSLVELPSPYAGVVQALMVEEGVTVEVGTPIITVDVDPSGAVDVDPSGAVDLVPTIPMPGQDEAVEPGLIGGPAPGGRTSVLVGYGPRTTAAVRRPRKGAAASADAASGSGDATRRVFAKPPVRKLARDLGVDLSTVTASGPQATVTRADVEAAAGAGAVASAPAVSGAAGAGPAFDPVTRERRYPIKGVRKATAAAMVASAFSAPHVTEFVTVDVTRTMKLLDRLSASRDFEGVRVSPLLIVMKALLVAVRRNPDINASWDEAAGEIVVKDYVNLGIATASPRGLLVPNIKNADGLSLVELCQALTDLASNARQGRTAPADMAGGTVTITNVGVFGVDTGTPILNPGEAAILCLGAIRERPWVHKGKVRPRQVTQLGLSFDHRLVDGELGSRFLADLATLLEHPDTGLAWG